MISPTPRQARRLTVLLGILALLCLLSAGVIHRSETFQLRGVGRLTDPPVPHGPPRLGVNVDLTRYDDAELAAALAEIADLGIQGVKQSFFFEESYDWSAADRIFAAAAGRPELTFVPLLDGNPADVYAPPAVEAYAAWAATFAARYGSQVDAYVIWDEPNLASHWGGEAINPDLYGALLTAAAAAIREADPHAVIVAAPLAPTVESGQTNLADYLYLQALYENGAAAAFDVAAAKPYGFDYPPGDRTVDPAVLNFSRAILLREVMVANGDGHKALWAGSWGWNALPPGWNGPPSIWGEVSSEEKWTYIEEGLTRARTEWPWMGWMFLHHWNPAAGPNDPQQGFALADDPEIGRLARLALPPDLAYPGFHFASAEDPNQRYEGDWEFSPEFGADVSQKLEGEPADRVTFQFWGTDVGLRVRRANYRARFYVLVDGQPANRLPLDETSLSAGHGSALVLNTNDPDEDYLAVEVVADGLEPGPHTLEITTYRGWDQFALNGFSVAYTPSFPYDFWRAAALAAAIVLSGAAALTARSGRWGETRFGRRLGRLSERGQLLLTLIAGALVALSGWMTWGAQAAGLYRRLGDGGQLALILGTAVVYYVSPWFFVYAAALLALFALLLLRPAWGLALTALTFPFYVKDLLKPVLTYRFSPVEVFMLVTFAAALVHLLWRWSRERTTGRPRWGGRLRPADWAVILFVTVATLSLGFTERLDVATNEWRVVIVEPALFYLTLRLLRPSGREMGLILDAFVAGGLLVSLIGLGQYLVGANLITAEGGLQRLRATYGSPNNVALYLGRIIPFLLAYLLLLSPPGWRGWLPAFWRRRRTLIYGGCLVLLLAAFGLTFSKGGLFLGLPAGVAAVFIVWQRAGKRPVWPWLAGAAGAGVAAYLILLQIPSLSSRLDLFSATGFFRLNLWQSSINMWREHPWFGVGLDNFLYAYRSRYILAAAWQEPNLNHPHNLVLDLATRLGLAGLIAGSWLLFITVRLLWQAVREPAALPRRWWATAVGLLGSMVYLLAHGLVDHSLFLIDLAFAFYLILGIAVWLRERPISTQERQWGSDIAKTNETENPK